MNLDEIQREISTLEQGETNWQNIQRLSWLYTVSTHLNNDQRVPVKTAVMPSYGGEFGGIVSGVPVDDLMTILTEHMAVIKILHPKEYEAVLQRIREVQ